MKKAITALISFVAACTAVFSLSACNKDDTIYVDTNAYFAPFEYFDSKGEIKGVDIDIMNMVGKELNKNVKFTHTEFNVIIDNVASGKKFDCGAAGITITEARKQQVDFSKPYYTAVQYAIFKTDSLTVNSSEASGSNVDYVLWSQLRSKKIGVQLDTTGNIYVDAEMTDDADGKGTPGELYNAETQQAYAGTSLVPYPSAPVAINFLLNDTIDVIVVDELPAKYLVKNNSGIVCYPLYYDATTATEEQYAICVTKGNTSLLNAINKVLDDLGENGVNALVSKHLGISE